MHITFPKQIGIFTEARELNDVSVLDNIKDSYSLVKK